MIKLEENQEKAKEIIRSDDEVNLFQSKLIKEKIKNFAENPCDVINLAENNVKKYINKEIKKINFTYEFQEKNIKLSLNPKITNKLHDVFFKTAVKSYEFTYWNYITSLKLPINCCRNTDKVQYFKIEKEK